MTWTFYARGIVAAAIIGIGAGTLFGREAGTIAAVCFLIGWRVQAERL